MFSEIIHVQFIEKFTLATQKPWALYNTCTLQENVYDIGKTLVYYFAAVPKNIFFSHLKCMCSL